MKFGTSVGGIVRLMHILAVTAILIGGMLFVSKAEATWSVGMFTVHRPNQCSLLGEHCTWIATELDFYPTPECTRITYRGIDYETVLRNNGSSLTMTLHEGRAYGWAIPKRFQVLNPQWNINSHWRYYNTCR